MTLPVLISIPVPSWYEDIMAFLSFLNFDFFSYQLFIDDPSCLGSYSAQVSSASSVLRARRACRRA